MGKDLSEIEDDYKTAYDLEIDRYRECLKTRKNVEKARKVFYDNFKKLLTKRNKQYVNYVYKNKEKILGMPERKKRKEEKFKVYHAYHIDFKRVFFGRLLHKFHVFGFNFILFFRSLRYNFFPSWFKYLFFRVGVFFSSCRVDFANFFRLVNHNFMRIFIRYYERIRERILLIYSKIKKKFDDWKEARKAKIEAKKQKDEERKQKMEEDAQKRQEQEQAALDKLKEIDKVVVGKEYSGDEKEGEDGSS
jgi:hypothetical protein